MTYAVNIDTHCESYIGNIQLVLLKAIRSILNIPLCENIALNVTQAATCLNESNNHEHCRTKYEIR